MKEYKRVLTIAGSDSGGGAGIQADLKTFSACGCYGMSAITAVTAQNTKGVRDIHPVPVPCIEAQICAVLDDIGIDAIKIGMLHSSAVISSIASLIEKYECKNIVLDPVMVATSGDPLIEEDAIVALKERLLPLVDLITPNIPEASLLMGKKIEDKNQLVEIARNLGQHYSISVLVKAGHLETKELNDVLWENQRQKTITFSNTRIETQNTHGTGCTLSSAITAFMSRGHSLAESVQKAEEYLQGAIGVGAEYILGKGHGPVHHYFRFWE